MTKAKTEALLNEWMQKTRALELQLNQLMEIIGCNPESPLIDAVSQAQDMLCKMIAGKTGGDEAMLSDWWLSHDFGQQPMAVCAEGQDWRDLTSNADMADFILEVAR